jgi:hypothetical protein
MNHHRIFTALGKLAKKILIASLSPSFGICIPFLYVRQANAAKHTANAARSANHIPTRIYKNISNYRLFLQDLMMNRQYYVMNLDQRRNLVLQSRLAI